jgi:hypothetical protein
LIEDKLSLSTLADVVNKNIDSENFIEHAKTIKVKDIKFFLKEFTSQLENA